MISGVTVTIDGQSQTLRMTTRAMMAIEQRFDKGLVDIIQGMHEGFKVSDLVAILAECANDGAGISVEDAAAMIDHVGVTRAGEILGQVAEAAFPDARGAAGKNAKGAARSK